MTTWFSMARYGIDSEDLWMPFDRVRRVRDGESFPAGDRTLVAVRPLFPAIAKASQAYVAGEAFAGELGENVGGVTGHLLLAAVVAAAR